MAVLEPYAQVVRRLLYFFALLSLAASSLLAQLGGNPGVNICQAAAAPAMVRGEGIAELAADIVVTCINGTAPGTPVTASEVLMNVFVRTNVDITNNVDFGAGAAITDAALVVNENNCPSPSASGGVFGGCGAPSPVYQNPQFGSRAAADRLQWLSVRVPVPGGPGPNGPHPSTTTIRITSIRVRASQPGVPHAASIPSSPFSATVTLAASGFSIGANNVVGIALPILGLMTSLPSDSAGELCRAGAATVPMILRENFAAVLRVAGPPSFFPEQSRTESGYFGNAHPGRILVRFSNIPPGARLTLPKLIETGNPSGLPGVTGQSGTCSIHYFGQNAPASQLTTPIPPGGRLAFALSTGAPSMGVPAAPNFSGYITANCEFPFARGFAAVTEHQNPALPPGASPAVAGYGLAAESFHVPVIAFPEEEPPPSTELLIPYVSVRGGHETLLSVSNVSLDGIGTPPQAGACTLEYHRDGSSPAPAPQIFALAAGEQTVFRLSVGDPVHAIAPAPGFFGYFTLSCDFRRARATALVRSPAAGSANAAFAHPAEALALPRNVAPEPLLRSYVSNRPGEDRVIVFANTSRDPFGSTPAGGVCSLSFRGPGAPAPSGLLLSAGTVRAFLLSRGLPALGVPAALGFQGFLRALCDVGLVRALDYRINPQPGLAPFCQVDSNQGFQPSDVVTLTAMLGQIVPIGHPGDPDGDSSITAADVQYCNNLAVATQPDPEPEPNPDAGPGPGPSPDPVPNPDPSDPSTGADLGIAFESSPAVARPQRSLKLRALISNAGSAAAQNVAAVVHLPAAFVLSSGPDACTGDDVARACNLGALAAGQAVRLQFSGEVSAAASAELTAYAELSSSTLDPNPANNAVHHIVPLESQADIAASAYLVPRFPAPGQTATLNVSVTNRGPAFANAVRLQALLGPSVLLHHVPAGCSLAGRELQCGIGALPAGRTRAYLLPVRISAGGGAQGGGEGSFVSTVTGSASTSEYKPENNTFTLMTVSAP